MNIPELRRRIAREPDRADVRAARDECPELLTRLEQLGGVRLMDAARAWPPKERAHCYGHLLGAPLSEDEIEAWQRRYPQYPLPADLKLLLRAADGVHLWADAKTRRSFSGLAPLQEWRPARSAFYGDVADAPPLPEKYLAISYHVDNAELVVLDCQAERYFLMDPITADEEAPIASNASELLDWLWENRSAPDWGD